MHWMKLAEYFQFYLGPKLPLLRVGVIFNPTPFCSFLSPECSRGYCGNFLHIQSKRAWGVNRVTNRKGKKRKRKIHSDCSYCCSYTQITHRKINTVCEHVVLLWTQLHALKSGQTPSTLHAISMTKCKNTSRNKCFLKWIKSNTVLHGEMHIFKAV